MLIHNQPILVAKPQNPESLIEWREYPDSLTDKLNAIKGSTQLDLLSQKWVKPTWWDIHALQIKDQLIFQREIMMKHHNLEYWYARSIIPQSCYHKDPNMFKRLEHESIRNLIFGNPDIHRVKILNYPINSQCIEYYWVNKYLNFVSGIIWVRLAEYSLKHRESFYLAELLLPELERIT